MFPPATSRLLHATFTVKHFASSRHSNFLLLRYRFLSVSRNNHLFCNNVNTHRQWIVLGYLPSTTSSPVCVKFQNASIIQNLIGRSHQFCSYSQNYMSLYLLPWNCNKVVPLSSGCKNIGIGRSLLSSANRDLGKQSSIIFQQKEFFHMSPRNNIHPLILIVVNQGARLASIIGGRFFRKWWQGLTPIEKQKYKDSIWAKRRYIAAAFGLLVLAFLGHYYQHLQSTPITKRSRYIAVTSQQFLQIIQFELAMQYEAVKDKIVPVDHPAYKAIIDIVQNIVRGNQDIDFLRNQNWTVIVVDSDEANAAVLPTGHIFVNTGMLKVAQNRDQLAVVLGHEMAHALLNHGAEMISYATVLNFVVIVVMAAIWAFMPNDGIAIVTQWFYKTVVNILLHLPYSRRLELEADEVGLQLTAKGCYDIRESSVFWRLMALRTEGTDNVEVPEWISTHPASEIRAELMDTLIPKAIKQRESCNCPALPAKDPRDAMAAFLREFAEMQKEKAVMEMSHDASKK